jgi:hypothetical protein
MPPYARCGATARTLTGAGPMSTTKAQAAIVLHDKSTWDTVVEDGTLAMSWVQRGMLYVAGELIRLKISLDELEAGSPIIAEGLAAGKAWAIVHNIPIVPLVNEGMVMISLLGEWANSLTAPPVVTAPAPLPAAA